MIHNWNNSLEIFGSIVNTFEIKTDIEFEKGFKADINMLERIILGLNPSCPNIYVSIEYSSSPKIEFLDPKSYNTFFTFFEFVESSFLTCSSLE